MAEYFRKINNDGGVHILRKKVNIDEVQDLTTVINNIQTSITNIQNNGKTPHFYITGNAGGTLYTHAGIYESVPRDSTLFSGGISYNHDTDVSSSLFAHKVTEAGTYKISFHAFCKSDNVSSGQPTRVRFDMLNNNNNVGIIGHGLINTQNEIADVIEGISQDDSDNANFNDTASGTETTDQWYGRNIIIQGFGVAQYDVDDVIKIRMYAWVHRDVTITAGSALGTPFFLRPRILVEKIW